MEIRAAREADLPQIQRLYLELLTVEAALQPKYIRVEPHRPGFLEARVEDETSGLFVAVEGERLLGFVLAQEMATPDFPCMVPRRFAAVLDLSVDPAQRGRGTGSALLTQVKAWAGERGLDYVELTPLSNNEGAIRLYQREGFQPVQLVLRMEL